MLAAFLQTIYLSGPPRAAILRLSMVWAKVKRGGYGAAPPLDRSRIAIVASRADGSSKNATGAPKVACRNVWKVFGPDPQETMRALQSAGRSKDDLMADSGDVVAVRDVSFDVQEGETFVVMGLSGSGKSTLLRCLPRLIDPTAGSILVDGIDMATVAKEQLRTLRRHKMSMVFQHFGLFPHRTIIDNVAYGLEVQGVKKGPRHAKAREVIDLVNLSGWENHYPGQLSGGMQQRVGLARALAVDPEILLFDEPFSALDPLIRREMQDELINLQQQMHKTLIFITHDFAEAIKLGDHIAIMKDGEFVQVGTPEEVVLHPADDYVPSSRRRAAVKVVTGGRPCSRSATRLPRPRHRRQRQTGTDHVAGGQRPSAAARGGCRQQAHRPDRPTLNILMVLSHDGATRVTTVASTPRKIQPQPPYPLSIVAAGLVAFYVLLTLLPVDIRHFPESWDIGLSEAIDKMQSWVIGARTTNPLFVYVIDPISDFIDWLLRCGRGMLIGAPWPAVLLAVFFVAFKAAGGKVAALSIFGLMVMGAFGLWDEEHADAGPDERLGRHRPGHRHPPGHPHRALRPAAQHPAPGAGRHADHAGLCLFDPGGAYLWRGARAQRWWPPSSMPCRLPFASPTWASATCPRPRSRLLTPMARPRGRSCARCNCRWPCPPSWSASTRRS